MTSNIGIAITQSRIYKVCRTCLTQDLDMKCIFNSEVNSVPVYQMLFATTPVEIKPDDGLPNHLCSQCIQSLISAYKFQKMSIDNDFKLRNYITVVHSNSQSSGGRIINFENLHYKNNKTQPYELADDQEVVVKIESEDDDDDDVHTNEEIYKQLEEASMVDEDRLQHTKTGRLDIWSTGNKCIQLDDHDYFAQEQNDSFSDLLCCNICFARFEKKCVFDRHMQMHMPKLGQLSKAFARKLEKPVTVYLCNICKTAFETEQMLNLHKKVHEQPRRRSNEDYIQRGRVNMTFGKYNCTIQSKNSNIKPSHVCNICKKSFKTWEELTQHISEHQIKILYGTEQGSNTTVNVNVNIQTEKMYDCKTCSRSFNTAEEQNLHEKEHIPVENIPAVTNSIPNEKKIGILSQLESQIKAGQNEVSVKVTPDAVKHRLCSVKCELCGVFLSNSSNLKRHINRIHNRTDVAKDPLEIDIPILEKSKTGIYKCRICHQQFAKKSLVLVHENSHFINKLPTKKKDIKLLTPEIEITKPSKTSADHSKVVSSSHQLPAQPNKIQKLSDTKSTRTEISSIINKNEEKQKIKIKCLICIETFSHPKHMLSHLSVHNLASNGKAYICTICKKEFASISAEQLKQHNETHSKQKTSELNEQKFKCELCLKKFKNRSNMISHLSKHNIKSDGVTYTCSICNEELDSISPDKYKEHDKQHGREETKQKSTSSEIIEEKTLKRKTKLRKHEKNHKSEEFMIERETKKCHLCSKEYNSHYALKKHLKTLHKVNAKIKPFSERMKKIKKVLSRQAPIKKILRKEINKKIPMEQSKTIELPKRSSVKRNTKNPSNKCNTCEKVFLDEKYLKSHKKNHQQKQMPVLIPVYSDTADLNSIRETDTDPNAQYQCSICLSNLKRGGFSRHLRERHGKVYDGSTKEYCRDCKLFLENEEHLEYHKLNVHVS